MKILSLLLFFLLNLHGSYNPEYKIGDKVKNFSLTNVIDNKRVYLTDFYNKKAVVVVFTSNSCPYSKIYEDRLLELTQEFERKEIKFLFINSQTTEPEDTPAIMAKHAVQKDYSFPFLLDPEKEVARQFSATRSPEAFVLKNMKGNFILQYRGAIDDSPQAAKDVTSEYLKDAIQAVVTDGPVKVNEKRATGCVLK